MSSLVRVLIFLALMEAALATTFYPATYRKLGCWKDQSERAISILEGKYGLTGNYHERTSAIQKCAEAAFKHHSEVFSVQNGGQCCSSTNARSTYARYGASTDCKTGGEGGSWANDVYELKSIGKVHTKRMGCWKDTSTRAIPTLEKLDVNLDGEYTKRKDALRKCVAAAFDRGYTMIALQNGGWCAGARNAENIYGKYGPSGSCSQDGEGGPWANEVYQLDYEWIKNYE